MFFIGINGPALPYIISIIAIWSGIWLGYGKYFHLKSNDLNDSAKTIQHKTIARPDDGKIVYFNKILVRNQKAKSSSPENLYQKPRIYIDLEKDQYFIRFIKQPFKGYFNCLQNKSPPCFFIS
jgi:hypothetical protein